MEKQRPTWSYRTAVLQVGRSDTSDAAAEYRAFLAFDLASIAAGPKILSQSLCCTLCWRPQRAADAPRVPADGRDVAIGRGLVGSQPDAQCVDRAEPCCGGALGSWQPRASTPAEVELTYYVKQALAPEERTRSRSLRRRRPPRAITSTSSTARRAAATPRRARSSCWARSPTSARESLVEGKGVSRATAGAPSTFRSSPRTRRASRSSRAATPSPSASSGRRRHPQRLSLRPGRWYLLGLLHAQGGRRLSARGAPPRRARRRRAVPRPRAARGDLPRPLRRRRPRPRRGGRRRVLALPYHATRLLRQPAPARAARHLRRLLRAARRRAAASALAPAAQLAWQRAAVTDLHNGSFAAEYVAKKSGAYAVQVLLGGVHVMGSPFQVAVLAARTSARRRRTAPASARASRARRRASPSRPPTSTATCAPSAAMTLLSS